MGGKRKWHQGRDGFEAQAKLDGREVLLRVRWPRETERRGFVPRHPPIVGPDEHAGGEIWVSPDDWRVILDAVLPVLKVWADAEQERLLEELADDPQKLAYELAKRLGEL